MTSVALIADVVGAVYGVAPADIVSLRRAQELIWPRQVAMHVARRLGMTPGDIGLAMGGRDHVSVTAALDQVQRIAAGPVQRDELEEVLALVLAAEAARKRLGRERAARTPEEIARRALLTGTAATTISTDEIRALAGAVLVERWSPETRALVDAALEAASATPAVPGAAAPELETALSNLVIAVGAHLASMAGGRKEAHHG